MIEDRIPEIFSDGWRDPGDDIERLAYTILMAAGVLFGLAFAGYGIALLVNPALIANEQPKTNTAVLAPIMLFVGIGLLIGCGWFFARESKRWDFRGLSAERVVAGGLMFGLALITLAGVFFWEGGGRAIYVSVPLVGAGTAVMLLFLFVGLGCALAQEHHCVRKLRGVTVTRRFALDDTLGEHEEHPCPSDFGLTAAVQIALPDGKRLVLNPAESVYEQIFAGAQGTAFVARYRLVRFVPR